MTEIKNKSFSKTFLISLVILALFACFLVFKNFLVEIIIASVLVSILYPVYTWIKKFLWHKKNISAFIVCFLAVIFIILPAVNLVIYVGKKAVPAYNSAVLFINQNDQAIKNSIISRGSFFGLTESNFRQVSLDVMNRSSSAVMSLATSVAKATTSFLLSLGMIIFIMFFFFVDGENIIKKISNLLPLSKKHQDELFTKFREVSRTAFFVTFLVAAVQGVVGGLGFLIAGLGFLFPTIIIGALSLLPYIGSMLFYVPVGIYLIVTGSFWWGVFILLWGAIAVGNIDNILRMHLIKGKAQVNPIFVVFSIIGGVGLFGFWGIVIGPLIISLTVTVFHIYRLEFRKELKE